MSGIKMKYTFRILMAVLCFVAGVFVSGYVKQRIIDNQLSRPIINEQNLKDSLKIRVLQDGDSIAYKELKDVMRDEGLPHKILFYSMVMARQYHYSPASYDVYRYIKYVQDQRLEKKEMDIRTQRLISLFLTEDTIKELNWNKGNDF